MVWGSVPLGGLRPGTVRDGVANLRYDINALANIERELDKPIGEVFGEIQETGDVRLDVIRVLLWAGAKRFNRRMTPDLAGRVIQEYIEDHGDLEEMGTVIMEAVKKSGLYSEDEDEGANPKENAASSPNDEEKESDKPKPTTTQT